MGRILDRETRERREQDKMLATKPPHRAARPGPDPGSAAAIAKLPAAWRERNGVPEQAVAPVPGDGKRLTAGYARFSTRNQNEESIERQLDEIATYCEANGFELLPEDMFVDRFVSAEGMWTRKGLMGLLERLLAGFYQRIVIYDASRLARSYSDLPWLSRAVERSGAELHAANRGRLGAADVLVHSFSSSEERSRFALMSQYERRKMARTGRSPTGACYGYDPVPACPGELTIDEIEAGHIRWMAASYLSGLTPTECAADLQRRGVPSPSGSPYWRDQAVRQILVRPIYGGLLVYGKSQHWRDTVSGKKLSRLTSPDEWDASEVPHLRILDEATWNAVQVRLAERSIRPREEVRRGEYLLTKRLKCPVCDDGYFIVNNAFRGTQVSCGNHVRSRGCTNAHRYRMEDVEATVLECVAAAVDDDGHRAVFARLLDESESDVARASVGELERLERDIQRKQAEFDETFRAPDPDSPLAAGWEQRVAGVRGRVHAELTGLEARRDLLAARARRAEFLDHGRLATLRDAVERMREAIPFRPVEANGFLLRHEFRSFVTQVVLLQGEEAFAFRAVVKVSVDEADPTRLVELRAEFVPPEPTPVAECDAQRDLREAAERGDHALTDEEWALVEASVPPKVGWRKWARDGIPARTLIDAILFRMARGVPWNLMPAVFGERTDIKDAFVRLTYCGARDAVLNRLREASPARFEGQDPKFLAASSGGPSRGRGKARDT